MRLTASFLPAEEGAAGAAVWAWAQVRTDVGRWVALIGIEIERRLVDGGVLLLHRPAGSGVQGIEGVWLTPRDADAQRFLAGEFVRSALPGARAGAQAKEKNEG